MFSAAMLNAEAGAHPVPSDPREIDAALRAADFCWHRFPYLAERYGERGYRFTRSDSAWLTTLARLDPVLVAGQVRWLREVLATRGIPSVVLQTHLDILCDELETAVPGDRACYGKLRREADGLGEARRLRIADAQLAQLSEAFERAAEISWRSRLPHTPLLLVSAVADEIDGSFGAAASLSGWLTDRQRFPADWVAAVEATLAQARASAAASPSAASGLPR